MAELAVYDNDPTLYLFTSLTAGSSHIITATSRIETILKANKIPFKGVDTATDELAKKLFQRRARGKKLPLLVKEGFVIADLDQVEEWNEYDELKEALGAPAVPAPAVAVPLAASKTPSAPAASAAVGSAPGKENTPKQTPEQNLAIRQLGAEAASIAAAKKHVPAKISTTNPLLTAKASASSTPTSATTPSKPAVASPSAILSPRSIPLPSTPANVGKAQGEVVSEFHGRRVQSPGAEEIKMVEEQTAIKEVSSSEEEDSEEEDEEDSEEDSEEEEDDDEEEEEEETAQPAKIPAKADAKDAANEAPKPDAAAGVKKEAPTQAQPAKAADKAGVSVED